MYIGAQNNHNDHTSTPNRRHAIGRATPPSLLLAVANRHSHPDSTHRLDDLPSGLGVYMTDVGSRNRVVMSKIALETIRGLFIRSATLAVFFT